MPGSPQRATGSTSLPHCLCPTTHTLCHPTALPTLGPALGGHECPAPESSGQRKLFLGGTRLCGQRAAVAQEGHPRQQPHTAPALLGRRHGCVQASAPRAALHCWGKVGGTFGRAQLQALDSRGSGNRAVAPPPWRPWRPCTA